MVVAEGGAAGAAFTVAERVDLTAEQANVACDHSRRITGLERAIGVLDDVGGASMAQALKRALRNERRVGMGAKATDPQVALSLLQSRDREQRGQARKRRELQSRMDALKKSKSMNDLLHSNNKFKKNVDAIFFL